MSDWVPSANLEALASFVRFRYDPENNNTLIGEYSAVLQGLLEMGLGRHQIPHGDRRLLDHLVGTFLMLVSMSAPRRVCVAGLFHSIYGTTSYEHSTLPASAAPVLREAIGGDAEHLVRLYCTCDSAILLWSTAGITGPPFLVPRREGSAEAERLIPLSLQEFVDFAAIEIANEWEQQPPEHLGLTFEPYLRNLKAVAAARPQSSFSSAIVFDLADKVTA